jgi:hypothetical protein
VAKNGESRCRSKKRKVSFGSERRRKYRLEVEKEEEESLLLEVGGGKETGENIHTDFGGGNQSILQEWSFMLFPFSLSHSLLSNKLTSLRRTNESLLRIFLLATPKLQSEI